MKTRLKSLVRGVNSAAAYSVSRLPRRIHGSSVGIVCSPNPNENRGDDAMLLGSLRCLSEIEGVARPVVIASGPSSPQSLAQREGCEVVDRHGFFCCQQAFADECKLKWTLSQLQSLVVLGADVLDGSYGDVRPERMLHCFKLLSELRIPGRIVSFSVSERITEVARAAFRRYDKSCVFYARDPVSYRRLLQVGIDDVVLAADTAFLLEDDRRDVSDATNEFLNEHKGQLLGVSLHSTILGRSTGIDERIRYMAKALHTCAAKLGHAVVLLPHHPADVLRLERLRDYFSNSGGVAIHQLAGVPSAAAVKYVVGQCRHVFSSRMHVMIASLGMATPVTCFPYLGKFDGLCEHFELERPQLDPNRLPAEPSELGNRLIERVTIGDFEALRIQKRLPVITELARSNFRNLY